MKIRLRDLLGIWFRSFFLQASWNYERMQALGFAHAIGPLAGRLFPNDASGRAELLRRHLKRFNSNPVLTAYVLGAVARMEEEGRSAKEIEQFKRGTEAPLAAWGDTLFWGTLRPLGSAAGLAVYAALVRTSPGGAALFAPLAYAFVYNTLHLYHRVRGIFRGHRRGASVLEDLIRSPIRTLPDHLSRSGLVLVGFGAVLELTRADGDLGFPTTFTVAVLAACAFASVRVLRAPISVAAMALAVCLSLGSALGWIGR